MKEEVLKKQVGGEHYKDMQIQPVEFIHANNIPFIEGACIKYLCRHRNKGGAEDIKKVIHFCEMLLELEYGEGEIEVNTDGSLKCGIAVTPNGEILKSPDTDITKAPCYYFINEIKQARDCQYVTTLHPKLTPTKKTW